MMFQWSIVGLTDMWNKKIALEIHCLAAKVWEVEKRMPGLHEGYKGMMGSCSAG